MIIAVPLFAMIYSLVRELVDDQLRRKGLPVKAYAYLSNQPDMGEAEQADADGQEVTAPSSETQSPAEPEADGVREAEDAKPRSSRSRPAINPKTNRPRRSGRPQGLDCGRGDEKGKDDSGH